MRKPGAESTSRLSRGWRRDRPRERYRDAVVVAAGNDPIASAANLAELQADLSE
jgi:hypothetical protein